MTKESIIQWDHTHHFESDNQHKAKKVQTVFWLTTVVMVLEIAAGTWSGSMALLADGWHMGTHSAAFAITIFAYWYATKHANNRDFSFGTGKVSYLGGFASAIALVIVALMMAIESIERLINPQNIHFNEAILVAIIGLIVNVASVFLLSDNHSHANSHATNNEDNLKQTHHSDHNLKAAYFHVLADTLTSVLAIIALLAGKFLGLIWVDAVMGIVGAIVISRWSYELIKDTSKVLLDKTPEDYCVEKNAATFKKNCQQANSEIIIHDFHIWEIAPNNQAAIISISTEPPLDIDTYKKLLLLQAPQLFHISIEFNKI